jgi:hypothetical protein
MSAAWTIITDAITAIMDRSFHVRSVSAAARYEELIDTHQWPTTKTIDQEPWDKRSEEEPCVQETGHQAGSVGVKTKTLLEQSAGVVCSIIRIGRCFLKNGFRLTDQGIDATKLLEDLDTASDEEPPARVDDYERMVSSIQVIKTAVVNSPSERSKSVQLEAPAEVSRATVPTIISYSALTSESVILPLCMRRKTS